MLRCLQSPENFAGDTPKMSVLERQNASSKLRIVQQEQQEQHLSLCQKNFFNGSKPIEYGSMPAINVGLMMHREKLNWSAKIVDYLNHNSPDIGDFRIDGDRLDFAASEADRHRFPSISSAPTMNIEAAASRIPEGNESRGGSALKGNKASMISREKVKKRKAEFNDWEKEEEDCTENQTEGDAGDVQSEVTERSHKETSGSTTKGNAKDQKPDYIHVRARRGQATDSHSLAERARREKISKKMKCLQDLVPGCSKVTGKAGMLDEIINYVQSLQGQVEFLSMKLAALNPQFDFNNVDNLFAKEIPAHIAGFPTSVVTSSSEVANLASFLQYHAAAEAGGASSFGLNPTQVVSQTTSASPSLSVPEPYVDDASYLPQQVQHLSSWDAGLQGLFNLGFQ